MEDSKNNFNFEKWLVGFTDGDGSFIIYKTQNAYGIAFKISQNKYNKRILYYIKKNLGVGNVSEEKNSNMAQYSVYSREKLKKYIIPIFDKYPLLTNKYFNYKKFKEAFNILENHNLSYEEKKRLIENLIILKPDIDYISPVLYSFKYFYKKDLNQGLQRPRALGTSLPESESEDSAGIIPINENYIKKIINKEWLIGFVEAEGSFYISKNLLNYVQYFGICQKNGKHLLEGIKIILKINANVYYSERDKCYYLQTKSKKSIKFIINFVDGFLKGVKSLEFKLWKRAFNNNYNNKKLEKIQLIMRKIREKNSLD